MKFWVTMQGRDAEVECDARDGKVFAIVGGKRLEADFVRLPDGEVYSLLVDGRSHEVRVSHHGEGLDVTANGLTIPVEVRNPLEKLLLQQAGGHRKSRGETMVAPMPGVVVAIKVKVGEVVQPGQPVIVVEAMKMQNELAAQTGGLVTEILVTERAAVAAGQAMVKMKPEGAS